MESSTLISLWQESLGLLHWSTSKLLFLASLNTFIRAIGLIIKYFWWLIVAIIAFNIGALYKNTGIFHEICLYSSIVLLNMYLFYFLLAVRPSVERKDFCYFFRYFPALIIFILSAFPYIFSFGNNFVLSLLSSLLGHFLFIFMNYSTFFFLDSDLSLSSLIPSIKRGFALVWSFFPGIMLFNLIIFTISIIFSFIIGLLGTLLVYSLNLQVGILGLIAALITSGLHAALTSVLYTKIKHSHFSLFFE
ncbi:hypothetical protein JST56_06680 [Candidatus Dependentiae bacterium]|nr:hypothetical protein [Candidatus Dependentiae bacterium]